MKTKRELLKRLASNGQSGMTLIEIMVVIAIIGIVSSAVGYGVTRYFAQAKVDACKAQLDNIASHVEMYLYEHDEYPNGLDDLTKTTERNKKKTLKNSQLRDPWKTKLIYATEGDGFKLCSAGPDKREGSGDDICFGEDEENQD